ncbi:MAG: hypothetical protein AAFO06_03935 [Cyanobacteria bacterium J06597_16]
MSRNSWCLSSSKNGRFFRDDYLDGEEFGRGDASQLWAHTGGIGLGGVNGGTLFHDGTKVSSGSGLVGALDEVRIYNSALTEGQVQGILA